MKKNVTLQKMENKSKKTFIKKKKNNIHIPSVSEIFSTSNGTSYWLPIGSNNNTPIKINTHKMALKWANE